MLKYFAIPVTSGTYHKGVPQREANSFPLEETLFKRSHVFREKKGSQRSYQEENLMNEPSPLLSDTHTHTHTHTHKDEHLSLDPFTWRWEYTITFKDP